jgi:4-diphosphocytidyl-2-C-methyl-D-erythritol kinase
MTIRAHAKINLDLRLGKRRPDGFHPIDTFFIRVDVADILEIRSTANGKITLQVEGDPELSSHPDNLVVRAARALQLHASPGSGADILLKKRIPQGAGLGGGSSDAASTLICLRKLWDVSLEDSELAKIGAELGSDVPFFLQPYAARGTGRGEILEPIHLIHLPWAVLLHPGFASPTASAYAAYAKNPVPGAEGLALSLTTKDGSELKIIPRNDLENAVESKFLWIGSARRWMGTQKNVLASRMSGSGSTVFGLFPSQEEAEKSADHGRKFFGSQAWIQVARLLGGPE